MNVDDRVEKLKVIRQRTDLTLRPTQHLRKTFIGFDGEEHDLQLRYYQVQGILHLLAVPRFLLGDDTGLGKTIQAIAASLSITARVPLPPGSTKRSASGQSSKA